MAGCHNKLSPSPPQEFTAPVDVPLMLPAMWLLYVTKPLLKRNGDSRRLHEFFSTETISVTVSPLYVYFSFSRPGYGLDGPGFEIWQGQQNFLLQNVQNRTGAHSASHSMGTGVLSRRYSGQGKTLTIRQHLHTMLRMNGSIPLLPLYAFTGWTIPPALHTHSPITDNI